MQNISTREKLQSRFHLPFFFFFCGTIAGLLYKKHSIVCQLSHEKLLPVDTKHDDTFVAHRIGFVFASI